MRFSSFAPLLVGLCLAGCGAGDDTSSAAAAEQHETLSVSTPEFDVEAGDVFECFYTDTITQKELSVMSTVGVQGEGGHHIAVYYTDTPKDPQHHPCEDAEMIEWHQILVASGKDQGEPAVSFPEGVAIKVPEGKQIVLQSHYINTTGATMKVKDTVTLNLGDPSDVTAYTNMWAINDGSFTIAPSSTTKRSSLCTLTRDLDIIMIGGHMHELGKHFKLEQVDDQGTPTKLIYDEEWSPSYSSHPPVVRMPLDAPLSLAKGTRVKQTCTWDNTTSDEVKFPREMCVTFSYYVPDEHGMFVCLSTPTDG